MLHFGARLPPVTNLSAIDAMRTRAHAWGAPDAPVPLTLAAGQGGGHLGSPGIVMHRDGQGWAARALVEQVEREGDALAIHCRDDEAGVAIVFRFALIAGGGLLAASTELANRGDAPLTLERLASISLPLPDRFTQALALTGRWAHEFQVERIALPPGQWLRENRRGRSSHDAFPGAVLCEAATDETRGAAIGLALAWSGNHRIAVERLQEGGVVLQAGALFLPGEMRLAKGQRYRSPDALIGWSGIGFDALSHAFHAAVPGPEKPRPVHYNCWEAVYFAHDLDRLKSLADSAAAIGSERFVLDDGWFRGRDHDRAGLGDWTPDAVKYPEGLGPLVEHVRGLGMEFGLWVEPEMVNPDSDLYRAHPDWVFAAPGVPQVSSRHQYVLDLTRAEVTDYLFGALDALLTAHPIGYLKWDMNRDVHHPGGADGRPVMTAYVEALYALIDGLRAAHPHVEIESCASGGGRADFGMLARSERVWTSDCNDARRRQAIQHGASLFLPLRTTGAHVGPSPSHQTGRRLPMHFRAATAIFGHMGVEADLSQLDADDSRILAAAIALHKRHRALIHGGELVRIAFDGTVRSFGVVAADRSEALFSHALLEPHGSVYPPMLRFAGLDPARDYRVRLVWPETPVWLTEPNALTELGIAGEGALLPGALLIETGLQLPLLFPDTCLIFHCDAA